MRSVYGSRLTARTRAGTHTHTHTPVELGKKALVRLREQLDRVVVVSSAVLEVLLQHFRALPWQFDLAQLVCFSQLLFLGPV